MEVIEYLYQYRQVSLGWLAVRYTQYFRTKENPYYDEIKMTLAQSNTLTIVINSSGLHTIVQSDCRYGAKR